MQVLEYIMTRDGEHDTTAPQAEGSPHGVLADPPQPERLNKERDIEQQVQSQSYRPGLS